MCEKGFETEKLNGTITHTKPFIYVSYTYTSNETAISDSNMFL